MTSSSSSKLIQVMSYVIYRYSTLTVLPRIHLYNAMENYILSQENRLTTLEHKISQLQTKLESFENHTSKKQ